MSPAGRAVVLYVSGAWLRHRRVRRPGPRGAATGPRAGLPRILPAVDGRTDRAGEPLDAAARADRGIRRDARSCRHAPDPLGAGIKVVVADSLAPLVERIYSNPYGYGPSDIALATVYISVQVYADFAGYSAMAIGSAKLLGIDLVANFAQPYLSESLTEFWRRWHMSLSGWFRDYVFTPLHFAWRSWGTGGMVAALLTTFTLIGIWHGSTWQYALFGLLHGMLIALETITAKTPAQWRLAPSGRIARAARIVLTFTVVTLTFVLFRARDVHGALAMYGAMATQPWHVPRLPWQWPLGLALLVLAGDLIAASGYRFALLPRPVRWCAYHAGTIAILAALWAIHSWCPVCPVLHLQPLLIRRGAGISPALSARPLVSDALCGAGTSPRRPSFRRRES